MVLGESGARHATISAVLTCCPAMRRHRPLHHGATLCCCAPRAATCRAGAPVHPPLPPPPAPPFLQVEFHGCESEIDLGCHGEPEFSEWAWMPLAALPSSVVGFKQPVYARVADHFGPLITQRWGGCSSGMGRRALSV